MEDNDSKWVIGSMINLQMIGLFSISINNGKTNISNSRVRKVLLADPLF